MHAITIYTKAKPAARKFWHSCESPSLYINNIIMWYLIDL
jgi:hypothetical protein